MTREVEQVDQSDMQLSRRDIMGSSAVVAAGALGVGMVGTATAQDGPTDEISGTVEDTDGNAIDGATVVAVPHDSSLDALVTTTDASGAYSFATGDLHPDSNLYHVVARDGTEADPLRSQQNYPFIAAMGEAEIPDSVVVQNFATTWSQGDGTWADDATDDGAQDMFIAGDPQAGTLSDGSEAVVFDGTDDSGNHAMPSSLEGAGLEQWAVEFALQFDHSNENDLAGANPGNQLRVRANRDHNDSSDPGNIYCFLIDQGGNRMWFAPSSNPGLNDGQRHDVTISIDDATTSSASMIIDGSDVPLSFSETQNPSNFGSWSDGMRISAERTPPQNHLNVAIGAIRWHDQAIGSQTIGQYP